MATYSHRKDLQYRYSWNRSGIVSFVGEIGFCRMKTFLKRIVVHYRAIFLLIALLQISTCLLSIKSLTKGKRSLYITSKQIKPILNN